MIKAFAALPVASRPVLVVGGEGSARQDLEALAKTLGISDRVFLLGWRDDAEDMLAHFDCFVMGSWSEGTSVSLLEAMASGLAPVVTAVGGNPDVLGPGLAGQAVPAGDFQALAAKIRETLEPARRAALAHKARERVRAAYDLKQMVRAYEQIYERLLSPGS